MPLLRRERQALPRRTPHNLGRRCDLRSSLTRALGRSSLAPANFKPVAAVDRLDIEDLATRDSQNALDWGRHVLVHPVWKLDDNDGALARSAHQPATDRPRTPTKLAQHYVHIVKSSILRPRVYWPLRALSRCDTIWWGERGRSAPTRPQPDALHARSSWFAPPRASTMQVSLRLGSGSHGERFLAPNHRESVASLFEQVCRLAPAEMGRRGKARLPERSRSEARSELMLSWLIRVTQRSR
jgi:hypothetical protein